MLVFSDDKEKVLLHISDVSHVKPLLKRLYGTDENADKVKELILQNKRLTVLEIANMLEISFGTIQSILK